MNGATSTFHTVSTLGSGHLSYSWLFSTAYGIHFLYIIRFITTTKTSSCRKLVHMYITCICLQVPALEKQHFRASAWLRKHEDNLGGVCNDYWICLKLTREAWVKLLDPREKPLERPVCPIKPRDFWLKTQGVFVLGCLHEETLRFGSLHFKVST